MRVITGTARGRKLREPEGMASRPTTDNVKESMFNLIQFDIEGRRVLDLFAGTGQLGIEALSRGARSAVRTCGKFDLIFLDPPYDTGLLDKALANVVQFDILAEGGIIVCESRREKELPQLPQPYYLLTERSYGKIKLTLYGKGTHA